MRTPTKHVAKDGRVSWRVKFRVRRDGRDSSSSEVFPSQRDALRFAQLLDALGVHGALAQLEAETRAAGGPTLDELAAEFFAWKERDVRSDRTVADYRRDYDNWIKPALGSRPAASIAESDVQALIDSMRGRLAPKSIADRHAILHGVYAWATSPTRRKAAHNPCLATDLPKRVKTPPKGLRPNEWAALHAALRSIDADAADLAEFMLATGWRWSEATALDVFDVEDDGSTVWVSVTRVVRRNAANQFPVVDDAKSEAGMRRIRLDAGAADMVRRRVGSRTSGLVLTTKTGAKWHYSHFRERAWDPAVKAAGLTARNPTPHWLRHTAVGWLILTGKVSLTEIQRRIGHRHISTTSDVYARMIEDVSAEALEAFAAMRGAGDRLALSE